MSDPAVSVCIPTYNYARFIEAAVASACAQTYRDIEVVVSDNCSTDDTERIVGALAAGDARIRWHRNARNLGMQANFNRCLELASGKYVKFLCADDLLAPDCVARMIGSLDEPGIALVACGRRRIGADGRSGGYAGYATRRLTERGRDALQRCFFHGNLIGEPSAVMFRKADAERGFSEAYSQLVDLEMWFHLLGRGALRFLPEALCAIREHGDQATEDNLRWGAVLADKRRLFQAFRAQADEGVVLAGKALWDARMAVTVRRTVRAGRAVALAEIEEVFFPRLFRAFTYPVASALWDAGPGRIRARP